MLNNDLYIVDSLETLKKVLGRLMIDSATAIDLKTLTRKYEAGTEPNVQVLANDISADLFKLARSVDAAKIDAQPIYHIDPDCVKNRPFLIPMFSRFRMVTLTDEAKDIRLILRMGGSSSNRWEPVRTKAYLEGTQLDREYTV